MLKERERDREREQTPQHDHGNKDTIKGQTSNAKNGPPTVKPKKPNCKDKAKPNKNEEG